MNNIIVLGLKRKIILSSILFYFALVVIMFFAFAIATDRYDMDQEKQRIRITISNKKTELAKLTEGDVTLAKNMGRSPQIIRYLENPQDTNLKIEASETIENYRMHFSTKSLFYISDLDKIFHQETQEKSIAYKVDPALPENYWYNMTLYETEDFNFNINYNPNLNMTSRWINVPVFSGNHSIGMLGTGTDLTSFFLALNKDLPEGNSIYLFNSKGEITGGLDSTKLAKKVTLKELIGDDYADVLKIAENTEQNSIEFLSKDKLYAISFVDDLKWHLLQVKNFGKGGTIISERYMLPILLILLGLALVLIAINLAFFIVLKPFNKANEIISLILNSTSHLFLIIYEDGNIVHISNPMKNLLGLNESKTYSTESIYELAKDIPEFVKSISQALSCSLKGNDISHMRIMGEDRYFNISSRIGNSGSENKKRMTFIEFIDISDPVRTSLTDPLTQLSNRRALNQFLTKEWSRAIRNQAPISLLMFDLDHFKAFNDEYGHAKGDVLLQNLSAILQKSIRRAGDLACRMGGEEFCIVLPDTALGGAITIAEKIRVEVEKTLPVTTSIGIASDIPTQAKSCEDLLNLADKRLYAAKNSGRNKIVYRE